MKNKYQTFTKSTANVYKINTYINRNPNQYFRNKYEFLYFFCFFIVLIWIIKKIKLIFIYLYCKNFKVNDIIQVKIFHKNKFKHLCFILYNHNSDI